MISTEPVNNNNRRMKIDHAVNI